MKNKISLGLLGLYIIIRFFFTTWLDTRGEYSSYIFESILVAFMAYLHWADFKSQWKVNRKILLIAACAGVAGFIVFKLIRPFGIVLPFDITEGNVWIFLLLVAPILEELIFRFFAWKPVANKNKKAAWIFTSVLFSYAHLHAFWFVAPDIRSFVYYQAVYTLGLGLACGYMVFKHNSLAGAILVHGLFNLGFFLGALA